MGPCVSKPTSSRHQTTDERPQSSHGGNYASTPAHEASPARTTNGKKTPFFALYSPSPAHNLFSKNSPYRPSPSRSGSSTPKRLLKIPLSPAKHIIAALARRRGTAGLADSSNRGRSEFPRLDKRFGYSVDFFGTYELGDEVGRGHFGHTCEARFKHGDLKGQKVAVKIIPKSEMRTAIAIEDVRREVRILKALSGHSNFVQFYEAFEDDDSVYIVMELCEGGELLDRILARGGMYTEEAARTVVIQILSAAAFCHLQGVVHRDLKPENFLFVSKEENATLKAIDFGLSDFVRPDERLSDIVGSAYYVAPEVLHRSYAIEADMWSIGVISYVLLCGSRPFWARTESGIFRAVLRNNPNFDDGPWPLISPEAKDFVKRLLNKDSRRRMSAAQALNHPWIKATHKGKLPLDISIIKLLKGYVRSSPLRRSALKALSKTLTEEDVDFLKHQFLLLEPSPNGTINLDSVKMALMRNSTDAMIASRVPDFLSSLNSLQYRRLEFAEFCAGALSVHQLEGMDRWGFQARAAYEIFEEDGNRVIVIEELASVIGQNYPQFLFFNFDFQELGLGSSVPVHEVLHDWVRHTDGKLSFVGFIKILHGVSSRTFVNGGVKP